MKHDKVPFKDKDVDYIASRSSTSGSTDSGLKFRKETITSNANSATRSLGRIRNGNSSGTFKRVTLNTDGTGTVGSIDRHGVSSARDISGAAATRKINRLRKKQGNF